MRPGITFHFLPTQPHYRKTHAAAAPCPHCPRPRPGVAAGIEAGREGGRALFVISLGLGRCRCRDRDRDEEKTTGVGVGPSPRPRRFKLSPRKRKDSRIGGCPIAQAWEVRLTFFVLFNHNHLLTRIDRTAVPRTGRRLGRAATAARRLHRTVGGDRNGAFSSLCVPCFFEVSNGVSPRQI